MGYRGKVREQELARELRARGMTLLDIAHELNVSKSSVSLWVRDVPFTPSPRRYGPKQRPNRLRDKRLAEIAAMDAEGLARIGTLSEDAFFVAGVALYAGEGGKTEGEVRFANTDPTMVRFFCAWLRRFFEIEEQRLRVRVYLHMGLDLDDAQQHWSTVTRVPVAQFGKPYRAIADATIRLTKHEYGCAYVSYCCSRTHRAIMGQVRALLSPDAIPG
jgi:hypothetical protein